MKILYTLYLGLYFFIKKLHRIVPKNDPNGDIAGINAFIVIVFPTKLNSC